MDVMSTYMDTCGFHRPFNTLNTVKNRITKWYGHCSRRRLPRRAGRRVPPHRQCRRRCHRGRTRDRQVCGLLAAVRRRPTPSQQAPPPPAQARRGSRVRSSHSPPWGSLNQPASGQTRKIRHAQRRHLQDAGLVRCTRKRRNEGARARIVRTDGEKEAKSQGLVA